MKKVKKILLIAVLCLVVAFCTVVAFADNVVMINDDFKSSDLNWKVINNGDFSSLGSPWTELDSTSGTLRFNTANQAQGDICIVKAKSTNGVYLLSGLTGTNFDYTMEFKISNFIGGDPITNGERTAYAQVTNESVQLMFSAEKDGLYVYKNDNAWFKASNYAFVRGTVYTAKVTVRGTEAVITISHTADNISVEDVNYTYTLPAIGTLKKNNITIGSIENTAYSTAENKNAMWFLYNVKLENAYENKAIADDGLTLKNWAKYTNTKIQNIAYTLYGQRSFVALDDFTKDGSIIYQMPDNGKIKNFVISRRMDNSKQGNINLVLINGNGASKSLVEKTDFNIKPYYLDQGHMYYYCPTETLLSEMSTGDYSAIKIILENRGEATALSPAIVRAEFEYNRTSEMKNFNELDAPKGNTILMDNFNTSDFCWHSLAGTTVVDPTSSVFVSKGSDNVRFNTANSANTSVSITKNSNYSDVNIIPTVIKPNYALKSKIKVEKFASGNPLDTGDYSLKATVVNNNALLSYTIEKDGIYVLNKNRVWENIYPRSMLLTTYDVLAVVNKNNASLQFKYKNIIDKDELIVINYELPTDKSGYSLNNVTFGANEVASGTYIMTYVYGVELVNLTDNDILIDDCSTKVSWATYGSNIKFSPFSQKHYGQQNGEYDLVDYTIEGKEDNNNSIIYSAPTDSYLTDFALSRRVNSSMQGDLYVRLITADGKTQYLNTTSDDTQIGLISIPIWLNSGHCYYYYPTTALKNAMSSGNFTSLKANLVGGENANSTSPAILYSEIEYAYPEAYTIKDGYFDDFDNEITYFADITKNRSGSNNIDIIIASYDSNGKLVDCYVSNYQFEKGTRQVVFSGPIEKSSNNKVYFWDNLNPIIAPVEYK